MLVKENYPKHLLKMDVAGFYNGRSVLITGATGFVGKVLVEKLLRCCPDLKKLYVVVRRDGKQSAAERIKQILQLELFSRVHQECPCALSKLVPLDGDITFPDLGLGEHDISTVMEDVSVIMHVAATVKFNEPLRRASKLNFEGTINVAELARKIVNLKAFVHVSTAFSNYNRDFIEEVIYPSSIKPMDFLDLLKMENDEELSKMTNFIKMDHPNTYTFSKLLAENYLEEFCKDLPVIIIRPAIVSATWKEPFSGWSEKGVIITGIISQLAKGLLRTMMVNSKNTAELIPVDVCVNQIIVAAWDVVTYNTRMFSESKIAILNGVSSPTNPLTYKVFLHLLLKYISLYPCRKSYNYPGCTLTVSRPFYEFLFYYYHYLPAAALDVYLCVIGRQKLGVRLYSKMYTAVGEYSKFALKINKFSCRNVLELQDRLSSQDKNKFPISVKGMDWENYLKVCVKSTRSQILGECDETLPQARNNLKRLYYKTVLSKVVVTTILCYCVTKLILRCQLDTILSSSLNSMLWKTLNITYV